jgi:hypothetical protein
MVTEGENSVARKKKTGAQRRLRLIKVSVQAYLEPKQAEELRALSSRTRVPQQVYIREGIDAVLARYRSGSK